MKTYKIIRGYFNDYDKEVIKKGLTLEQARKHCMDPETSSRTCVEKEGLERTAKRGPWFDGYAEE